MTAFYPVIQRTGPAAAFETRKALANIARAECGEVNGCRITASDRLSAIAYDNELLGIARTVRLPDAERLRLDRLMKRIGRFS